MEYTVNHLLKSPECWIGTFEENDVLKYYCMDLGEVPPGRYQLTKYRSPAHGFDVPLVNNVPGHSGIEIHIGNYPKDTKGCLLLATNIGGKDFIQHSGSAIHPFYTNFFELIEKGEKCFITYKEFN